MAFSLDCFEREIMTSIHRSIPLPKAFESRE